MGFPDPHRDLGRVKVGSITTITYTFTPDITVSRIDTSCGCTIVQDTLDTVNTKREIVLEYKAKEVPIHLFREGKRNYPSAKQAVIFFEATGEPGITQEETLTFKATVYA